MLAERAGLGPSYRVGSLGGGVPASGPALCAPTTLRLLRRLALRDGVGCADCGTPEHGPDPSVPEALAVGVVVFAKHLQSNLPWAVRSWAALRHEDDRCRDLERRAWLAFCDTLEEVVRGCYVDGLLTRGFGDTNWVFIFTTFCSTFTVEGPLAKNRGHHDLQSAYVCAALCRCFVSSGSNKRDFPPTDLHRPAHYRRISPALSS
jgi:hypothetical protein